MQVVLLGKLCKNIALFCWVVAWKHLLSSFTIVVYSFLSCSCFCFHASYLIAFWDSGCSSCLALLFIAFCLMFLISPLIRSIWWDMSLKEQNLVWLIEGQLSNACIIRIIEGQDTLQTLVELWRHGLHHRGAILKSQNLVFIPLCSNKSVCSADSNHWRKNMIWMDFYT